MAKNTYDLEVNVMMVGGRRSGKTSVLAAMQNDFERVFGSVTPFTIGPADYDVLEVLEKKQRELKGYFVERGFKHDFVPDTTPTFDDQVYGFYIGLKGRDSRILVNFIDYPGEWLTRKDHLPQLEEYMSRSRILLVTIDTPYLMEKKGLYNDHRNLNFRVTEMIKKVGFADPDKGPGMVLFVPLKCERYKDQMNKVDEQVEKAYSDLLQYLIKQPTADGKRSKISVAITPILTLGGAEFSRFGRDDTTGEIKLDKYGAPEDSIYHFSDPTADAPAPKYCEQPLVYVLSYVLAEASRAKRGKNSFEAIVNFLESCIKHWPTAGDYLKQAEKVQKKLNQKNDGFIVLNKGIL